MEHPTWSHADVFPIIARAIETLHNSPSHFVTHEQIVTFLLDDAEASAHIDAARQESGNEQSREWIAHNMVAWFSQRITVDDSDWANRFERMKVDGKWAYKPKKLTPCRIIPSD